MLETGIHVRFVSTVFSRMKKFPSWEGCPPGGVVKDNDFFDYDVLSPKWQMEPPR